MTFRILTISWFFILTSIIKCYSQQIPYPYNYFQIAMLWSPPSEVLVTNSNDSGPGSLRDVIIQVNSQSNGNIKIGFRFNGSSIYLNSALPVITRYGVTIIDGATFIDLSGQPISGQNPAYIQIIANNNTTASSIPVRYMGGSHIGHCLIQNFQGFKGIKLSVTSSTTSYYGSYVDAVRMANTIPSTVDTIVFTIPGPGPHKIDQYPSNDEVPFIHELTGGVVIDGSTQPTNNSAYTGPLIEIQGYTRLDIKSSNVTIRNIHFYNMTGGITIGRYYRAIGDIRIENCVLNRCGTAILIDENSSYSQYISKVTIKDNIIGLLPDGETIASNTIGISVSGRNVEILNNTISGNTYSGIQSKNASSFNTYKLKIKGNKIGTNNTGTLAKANNIGINLSYVDSVEIGGINLEDGNLISGNTDAGIKIGDGIVNSNIKSLHVIQNNIIGTDITGLNPLPNKYGIVNDGEYFKYNIKDNIIAFNKEYSILNHHQSRLKNNRIFNNGYAFKNLYSSYGTIKITEPLPTGISGVTSPNFIVQLYYNHTANDKEQGKTFLGETTADNQGNFTYSGTIPQFCDVIAIGINPVGYSSTSYSTLKYTLGNDKLVCFGDVVNLDAGAGESYIWSTGENTRTISINASGEYFVKVQGGCINDTIKVNYSGPPSVNLGNDTTLCFGQFIVGNAGNLGAEYLWNGGTTNQTKNISGTGKHYVQVKIGSCLASDTINVTTLPSINVNLGADQTVCTGTDVILDAFNSGASYLWSSGKTTQKDTITSPGKYWLRVYRQHCQKTDTILINHSNHTVNLGKDTILCAGQSILLDAGNPGATFKWNNNSTLNTQTRNISTASSYFVEAKFGSCSKHDTIQVSFHLPINLNLGPDQVNCIGTTKILDAGISGVNYLWSTGATTQSVPITSDGSYAVKASRSEYCFGHDTVKITFKDCQKVNGIVFQDINLNGIKDGLTDSSVANSMVVLKNTSLNTEYYLTTDSLGSYSADVPLGNYFVSLNNGYNYSTVFPSSGNYTFTINGTTDLTDKNFGLKRNICSDVSISIVPISNFRLGTTGTYKITYQNIGTVVANGKIKALHDEFLTFTNSIPTNSDIVSDTLIWNYSNLLPLEKREILVHVAIPLNLSLFNIDVVSKAFAIAPNDTNQLNNLSVSSRKLSYPYDPNNKLVYPEGTTSEGYIHPNDSLLTYTINFQNTGTDTAYTVIIMDTLSAKLDVKTFALITSSHKLNYSISGTGVVQFVFKNIHLPDSIINEPLSHGYVQYSIGRKNGLVEGTVIENYASIYFDAALPVHTNKTKNTIRTMQKQNIDMPQLTDKFFDQEGLKLFGISDAGVNVTYAVSGPAKLIGDSIVFTGTGEVSVMAFNYGTSEIKYASSPIRSFFILKALQVLSLDSIPDKHVSSDPFSINVTGGKSGIPIIINVYSGPAEINNNMIVPTGPGTVTLVISQGGNENHSPATSIFATFKVAQETGITSNPLAGFNSIYPNPSKGSFTIVLSNLSGSEKVSGHIINLQGTIIRFFSIDKTSYSVNTTELSPGHYLLKLSSSDKQEIHLLQIE